MNSRCTQVDPTIKGKLYTEKYLCLIFTFKRVLLIKTVKYLSVK